MDINISLGSIQKSIYTFLHRFHVMVFTAIVLVGLIVTIFLLYNVVTESLDETNSTPSNQTTSFDETTIKRINELRTDDQSGEDLDLSQGRTNPFVE